MRYTNWKVVGILIAIAAVVIFMRDESKAGNTGEAGIVSRIQALEQQTKKDRETIAMLQMELKAARDEASKAVTDAKSLLEGQMRVNRKEVYTDMGSIFGPTDYADPALWEFGNSHVHAVKAEEAGYLVGIRNGHRSATHVGSYRMMPKSLQEKCNRIKAE